MELKIHYEVETVYDQKAEEVTINSFYKDDPLIARDEAFSFLRNYINVLKEENQVKVETKYSGPRNHAQFRFDSRTKNFDHDLKTYFVSQLEFKDSKFINGLKIYLVVDETFYTGEDFIDEHERHLVFQLGNHTKVSLIELINGLNREYFIHSQVDTFLTRNSEELDVTLFWHLFNQEQLETPIFKILKTPLQFHFSNWERLFSVFKPQRIYSLSIIKEAFIENLELDYVRLEHFNFKQLYKEISSLFYTSGGIIALKIDHLETNDETVKLLTKFNQLFNDLKRTGDLKNCKYNLINCKNKKGDYFLCLYVETFSWENPTQFIVPTKLHYRENGCIETLKDVNEIMIYLTQNF
ncbi:hypothetical protein [Empedobacter stercoris]|uniref:hypothetical protein n=1 Tax=Empedobacter stercoris TaxID=1628248 RepID=UPI0039ED7042